MLQEWSPEDQTTPRVGATAPVIITEKMREGYRAAFDLFDANRSGAIGRKELHKLLAALGQNPTEADISKVLRAVDVENNDGLIQYTEFEKYMSANQKSPETEEQELLAAFKMFDRDDSGVIDRAELTFVLTSLVGNGKPISKRDVRKTLSEFDKDHNGKINYPEFVKFTQKRVFGSE